MKELLIATNSDPDSTLAFLLRVPLGDGIVVRTAGTWPRTKALYCDPVPLEEWPAAPDIVQRVPLRSCVRRGAAIDLVDNSLIRAGGVSVLGTPVDLSRIDVPTFVTGAVTDHLTPWTGCYRTTELVSGPSTFVLSNAGHVAGLVNPPGNPKASYWVGGEPGSDPHAWRASAERRTGSWWEAWSAWVLKRSGEETPAPSNLGSERHPALEPAPGSYVLDRVPVRGRASEVGPVRAGRARSTAGGKR